MATPYENKLFSILGDSLSTLDGYNPAENAVFYDWQQKYLSGVYCPADTWWGRVIDALGGRLLVNDAFSGSLVCKHPSCQIPSYGCSDHRTGHLHRNDTQPDVILVLLGLNDWGCGMVIEPAEDKQDLSVFSLAYSAMLEKLKKNYPGAEIWCLTLPRSHWSAQPQAQLPIYRAGGHLRDYCDAIRRCAEAAGCRCLDIFRPETPYDTIDGYHADRSGMQTIATLVLQALEEEGML